MAEPTSVIFRALEFTPTGGPTTLMVWRYPPEAGVEAPYARSSVAPLPAREVHPFIAQPNIRVGGVPQDSLPGGHTPQSSG